MTSHRPTTSRALPHALPGAVRRDASCRPDSAPSVRRLPQSLAAAMLGAALATGTFAMPSTAHAQNAQTAPSATSDGTLLSVVADAQVSRAPDIATLSAGVVVQAADANAAMRANATQMNKVMAAIKAAGIADRDVQTSGVSLYPQYRYAENQPPAITGYQASNTVNVKVRDMSRLAATLDALAASGANQINGPTFEIDQPEEAYDEARVAALAKAQARAKTYADALGLRVRRIVSIQEGGAQQPGPVPVMMKAMRAEAEDTPIAPGENTLSATLSVVFELGR